MSTAEEIRRELTEAEAEKTRLRVVDDVLADVAYAAIDVRRAKDYADDAAEEAKLQHWDSVVGSVWAEQSAAAERWYAAHDRWITEVTLAERIEVTHSADQVRRKGIERSR